MYIKRTVKRKFTKLLKAYNLIAVVGPRQAGKTTFLREQLAGDGTYVLMDDPDALDLFDTDIKRFERQYLSGKKVTILDEMQYCADAGRKLKYLADVGHKMWLTSSSQVLLSKDILSYLVGRISVLTLYPFSLAEFLGTETLEHTPLQMSRAIWEHITYGGYPKVVLIQDNELKETILHDLHQTMILKDVAQTFSIDDIAALERTSRYIAQNIGCIFSFEAAARVMQLSFVTIKKYLDAMEKSYLLFRAVPYHTNKNKEMSKQPKVYFIDTGLRNALMRTFADKPDGHLFENYICSELLKAGYIPKYWHTKSKAEVDFIIEKGNELIAIECKLQADPAMIPTGLRSFILTYRPKRAFVVSYQHTTGDLTLEGCSVKVCDTLSLLEELNR